MLIQCGILFLGLLLVIKGGDLFVDASVIIAEKLKIPRMVIGGTIVSLATTGPEMVVSAMASAMGDSGIAIGNAVGSAICNIGLIVGLLAILGTVRVDLRAFRSRWIWMMAAAVMVFVFSWNLATTRRQGAVLIALALAYLIVDYLAVRKSRNPPGPPLAEKEKENAGLGREIVFFGLGAGLVIAGSRLLVISGSTLAAMMGVPSVIIGLSIIAVGTSLPELVTAVSSARKGVSDLSIGNIIGANVLNLGLITGTASVIRPLELTRFTQVYSFPWLTLFIAGMAWLLLRDGRLEKRDGFLLLGCYGLYLSGLILLPFLGLAGK